MNYTVIEKIIAKHTTQQVAPGEIVIADVDRAMASDTTGPMAINAFNEMGGSHPWDSKKMVFIIDHASPAPNERVANLHKKVRDFAIKTESNLHDIGSGICHQVMVDEGYVNPWDLIIGADSHSVTYGALGAFSTGVGSTDLAAVMLTGKVWLKVPPTIRVNLSGQLNDGVSSKDLVLFLVGETGLDGATYCALEFSHHPDLSLSSRMTIASMSVEMGGKAGVFEQPNHSDPVMPDENANYHKVIDVDLSQIVPKLSEPDSPDNVVDLAEHLGQPVDAGFIGTCTNGRLEDLQAAAKILNGKSLPVGVRLIITPASKKVLDDAVEDGTFSILSKSGATFIPPGCGPCVGTHLGVPADGETIISSANRNFPGRMGNKNAKVFLASPSTVAASALMGKITDPSELSIL